jgi:hypothetical protein
MSLVVFDSAAEHHAELVPIRQFAGFGWSQGLLGPIRDGFRPTGATFDVGLAFVRPKTEPTTRAAPAYCCSSNVLRNGQ